MIIGALYNRLALISLILAAASFGIAQQSGPPLNLPTPPPLSEEMIRRAPTEPPPDLPDPAELISQLKQLEELLSMGPEKLKSLRQTLEFIEKMSIEEREAMRIRLSQITQMTAELREEIDSLAKLLPNDRKTDLSQFWLAAQEEERQAIRDSLKSLEEEQKADLLSAKVADFVSHRDEVFQRMKDSLEAKRMNLAPPEK